MILTLSAALCIIVAVALWKASFQFTIDAAPVGGMMMIASVILGEVGVFLFALQIGMMIGSR